MKDGRLVIFRNSEEEKSCVGKYVLTKSFRDREALRDRKGEPIAEKKPEIALAKAKENGYASPVIIFLSDPKIKKVFLLGARC